MPSAAKDTYSAKFANVTLLNFALLSVSFVCRAQGKQGTIVSVSLSNKILSLKIFIIPNVLSRLLLYR